MKSIEIKLQHHNFLVLPTFTHQFLECKPRFRDELKKINSKFLMNYSLLQVN